MRAESIGIINSQVSPFCGTKQGTVSSCVAFLLILCRRCKPALICSKCTVLYLAYVAAFFVNYWRSIVKRIMNRTPRNAGQNFSIAAADSVVVVATVEGIIVVIVVGTGFPVVQVVSHIASVWFLLDTSVAVSLQIVVLCCSHVTCVKINRNSTVPKVSRTSFASYSGGGTLLNTVKFRK